MRHIAKRVLDVHMASPRWLDQPTEVGQIDQHNGQRHGDFSIGPEVLEGKEKWDNGSTGGPWAMRLVGQEAGCFTFIFWALGQGHRSVGKDWKRI